MLSMLVLAFVVVPGAVPTELPALVEGLAEAERRACPLVLLVTQGETPESNALLRALAAPQFGPEPSRVLFARADALNDPAVAAAFDVTEFPSLVVLDVHGRELDRLVGPKTADMLRVQLDDVLARAGDRAPFHAKFAAHPHAHAERANDLVMRRRYDEAVRERRRELDERGAASSEFERTRRNEALAELHRNERRVPDAPCTLVSLREAAVERLACGTAFPQDAGDLVSITALLAPVLAPIEVYERLEHDQRLSPALAAGLWPLVVDELVRRGRFADAARSWRLPMEAANELLPGLTDALYRRVAGCGNERFARLSKAVEDLPRLEGFYAACLGAEQWDALSTLERELTASIPDPRVNACFVRGSIRAGDCVRARAQLCQLERDVAPHLLPGIVPPWLAEVRECVARCR